MSLLTVGISTFHQGSRELADVQLPGGANPGWSNLGRRPVGSNGCSRFFSCLSNQLAQRSAPTFWTRGPGFGNSGRKRRSCGKNNNPSSPVVILIMIWLSLWTSNLVITWWISTYF